MKPQALTAETTCAGSELTAVSQWLGSAEIQQEASLARALAAAPQLFFEGPIPGELPLSAAAATHGFGSGRNLNTEELARRRPDGYQVMSFHYCLRI